MASLTTLAVELGEALKTRDLKLALAESCTGGMLAQIVTSVAGSSAWFDRGFVTYSNEAKMEMLGVKTETLEKFGAVSEQTAQEMALGCLKMAALKHSHAQVAGSITGIAGPDGGSKEKPVGTVCFAWCFAQAGTKLSLLTTTQHFFGNREEIRQQASIAWIAGLIERLKLLN